MKLRVIWPGKTKKEFYRLAITDYASRLAKLNSFEIVEAREAAYSDRNSQLRVKKESKTLREKKKSPVLVLVQSTGRMFSSEELAQWLEQQSSDIDFILGGPRGYELNGAALSLSLGKMTLPHELARVVLIEQLYRAVTIIKHIPYHK